MTIHANRLILGFEKIASYFRTLVLTARQERANLTRGGGLGFTFKLCLRRRQGVPLVLETLPMVGGSLGVNMTAR